ncbi:MAG TPA: hypothetical protein PKN99_00755 [Cyclobacteriaceae bacterium]|nr:hypothetical protein [Cyclobacteriaceae bacterium]
MQTNTCRLIVCDVCDTLYNSNTTFDFLCFVSRLHSPIGRVWFKIVTSRFSPLFYSLILCGRFLDIDLVRKSALLLIRNKSLFELKGLAEKFYNDFLKKRVNKQVINLIYKGEGRRIVLMSSSIDVVVNVIASSIGVECYSSELEYRNGLATGRLKTDLTGIKGEVTQHLLTAADSSVELTVITDNKTDWELMRMAQQRYVVVKSSNEKGFWKTLNPIFIEV